MSTTTTNNGTTANNGADEATAALLADLAYLPTPKVPDPWSVKNVLAQIPGGPPETGARSPIPFFHMLERLKTTKREGWRRFGISRPESIADHMYRMAMITMLCPPALAPRLDLGRCVRMCLVHDMAECLVGDITPVDGVAKPEKSRREAETIEFLTRDLLGGAPGGAAAGETIHAAWREYEDAVTLESQFVHDVDKMELLLQMVEYERRAGGRVDLGEFTYVADRMVLDETRVWGEDVLREREAFWKAAAEKDGGAAGAHCSRSTKDGGGGDAGGRPTEGSDGA